MVSSCRQLTTDEMDLYHSFITNGACGVLHALAFRKPKRQTCCCKLLQWSDCKWTEAWATRYVGQIKARSAQLKWSHLCAGIRGFALVKSTILSGQSKIKDLLKWLNHEAYMISDPCRRNNSWCDSRLEENKGWGPCYVDASHDLVPVTGHLSHINPL